jgi:hypothetical protein
MANEAAIVSAIESSNIDRHQKDNLLRHYGKKLGFFGGQRDPRVGGFMEKAKAHAMGSAHVLRQGGESAGVGAMLGALHVELPTGLDVHMGASGPAVPVDGIVAAAGLVGSVLWADNAYADDLRNAGSAALTVLAFRKTHDFMASRAAAKGVTPGSVVAAQSAGSAPAQQAASAAAHGDMGLDPIVALAQKL